MNEKITAEEKDVAQKFYKDYKTVSTTIKDLKNGASPKELEKLNLYERLLRALIESMVEYGKKVYVTVVYKKKNEVGGTENYQTREQLVEKTAEVNQSRIIHHNEIISQIKVADKICKALGVSPLYGKLEEFSDNVDPLMQTNPTDKSYMTERAKEKRQDIFKWVNTIVVLSVARDKAREHPDFIDDPTQFLSAADFYQNLNEDQIFSMFEGKINGR